MHLATPDHEQSIPLERIRVLDYEACPQVNVIDVYKPDGWIREPSNRPFGLAQVGSTYRNKR